MATKLNFTFGLPPGESTDEKIAGRTDVVMRNSMPLARIYPGIPVFSKGLDLFSRGGAFEPGGDALESLNKGSKNKKTLAYHSLLRQHGFELAQPEAQRGPNGCITVAYQADSFPTDTFTNEYGENFLQKFTDVASEGAASISQMLGVRSAGEAFKKLTGALGKTGDIGRKIGEGLQTGGGVAAEFLRSLPIVGGGTDVVSSLAAGSRIDFPMVWKTSGFQPSYTMTVRLYNPNPASEESTEKYIIGPIASLMLLGIPITADGATYSWPFIHRIWSPGLYDLDPAFISNITVIKGGDQQQISYPQRLGIVDVRIDFGSLFSTILAGSGINRTRPTLKKYIDSMKTVKTGVRNFSSIGLTEGSRLETGTGTQATSNVVQGIPRQAPTVQEITSEQRNNPPSRSKVSPTRQATAQNQAVEVGDINV